MCFKNLPIEFDAAGRARLADDRPDPYAYRTEPLDEQVGTLTELAARNGHLKTVDFDPVTRVAGALAFHSVVDLHAGRVVEANCVATMFRGYEVLLKGRKPSTAITVSSRACGVCGGVHAAAASLLIEMAFGVQPPPLGTLTRNLLNALEFLYDNTMHLFLLAGPDYSQSVIEETNPSVWARARKTPAPSSGVHGYRTIAAIMTDLDPLTGKLYLEALGKTRVARDAYIVVGKQYPHPTTVVPGGIRSGVDAAAFDAIHEKLREFFDYSKKVVAVWDDLCDFFYDCDPRYKQVGMRPATMIDLGMWDDPHAYDASYEHSPEWGARRWATPGAIVDGEVVTTNLQALNIGTEEFGEHSYYDTWDGSLFTSDPAGNPLSSNHPWNMETKPKPTGQSWREKYSWCTAPRWDRQVMEAECTARLWNTAAGGAFSRPRLIEPTGAGLRLDMPADGLPATELEWRVPDVWNAFERNRGRAYCVAYTTLVALDNWLLGRELLEKGVTEVNTSFKAPAKGTQVGAGFWGAGRGYLSHHGVIEDGLLTNYQIITSSTWNASPRDPWGNAGPYEEAILNTPLLEEFSGPDEYKGIDILRALRSFDPCMPCATHIHVHRSERVVRREVTTCACGSDR
ncbi:MAG: nickel-dependent hydrogenase large subunit [Actinomycetota bacterium]|nr:nickel-dependent hydrogenase large subunit [Actinomycetota bacterium]